jgi:K+-sensing histidine kinase KdpD
MSKVSLKQLLAKKRGIVSLINDLEASQDVIGILDAAGSVLYGKLEANALQYPIRADYEILGWVIGTEAALVIARLLTRLANKEAENVALSDDTLDLYREINLLYSLSEKLTSSVDLSIVAQLTLEESYRLIHSTDGLVVLVKTDSSGSTLVETIAEYTQPGLTPLQLDETTLYKLIGERKAEIINDINLDGRYVELSNTVSSLAYAPLKGKQDRLGVIILLSRSAITYTGRDVKLLNALASQAAPAIENAQFYEKTIREAHEREARLQKQIQELTIELDDARQDKQVADITESDYFQQLSKQADNLRKLMTE